jgi:hypothetical protein
MLVQNLQAKNVSLILDMGQFVAIEDYGKLDLYHLDVGPDSFPVGVTNRLFVDMHQDALRHLNVVSGSDCQIIDEAELA